MIYKFIIIMIVMMMNIIIIEILTKRECNDLIPVYDFGLRFVKESVDVKFLGFLPNCRIHMAAVEVQKDLIILKMTLELLFGNS